MTTYYWPVVLPIIAVGLAAYAILAALGYRSGKQHGYAEIKEEHHALCVDHGLAVHKADVLEQDNEHLQALIADRDEAIAELQAEIKALHMQTIEMPEVATAQPIAAKRTRTKKTTTEE